MKKKKVLLIGWDAADWKVINPLMDAGLMPSLNALVDQGTIGNLATLEPVLSPILWTSISTGKYADKHGVLGFTEPLPNLQGVRPISVLSRKAKAVWNILMQNGLKSHVIGWWPSHPSEPINGIYVSNVYQKINNAPYSKKNFNQLPKGTVHPPKYQSELAKLRLHHSELTYAHILPFVPKADKIDQEKDKRLDSVAKILAEATNIQTAATFAMENEEWDFMAVYFDAIDHFCHGFMNYHPPKLKGVSENDFDIYQEVVKSGYRYHDMMLEHMIKLAGEDATIILISDHGFQSDHLRPSYIPKEPAGPAHQHRPYGVVCMKGPGIKKDERIYGATLLDIAPTILSLYDIPIGEDFDGKPLLQAFESPPEISTIPSWEEVGGKAGMHDVLIDNELIDSEEMIEQLVELGYIEKPDENKQKAAENSIYEQKINLARVYLSTQRYHEALSLLEPFYEKHLDVRLGLLISHCYSELNQGEDFYSLCESLYKNIEEKLLKPEEFEELRKRLEAHKQDVDKEEIRADLELVEKHQLYLYYLSSLQLQHADHLYQDGDDQKAMGLYSTLLQGAPNNKSLLYRVGMQMMFLKKFDQAKEALDKTIQIDPDFANGFYGLGMLHYNTKKYWEAIDCFLTSIGLLYHFPFAHYHLGMALLQVEKIENAAEALEVCLKMNPNIGKARNKLIEIYSTKIPNPQRVEQLKNIIYYSDIKPDNDENEPNVQKEKNNQAVDQNTIIVVSGLPRSGTSMMMQMMEAAGLELFVDEKRRADENNRKGYFEHELVKSIGRNKKWLSDVTGKVIKIVSPLLFTLPARYRYKIIFMKRPLEEIIDSQSKMLKQLKKKEEQTFPAGLMMQYSQNFKKVNNWVKKNPNVQLLEVDYHKTMNNTNDVADRLVDFLGIELNTEEMVKVVDPTLYRSRISS